MPPVTFTGMLGRLLRAEGQGRAAKTVEINGWIVLVEGSIALFAPQFAATVLGIPPLSDQGADYFRLSAVWICGLAVLYIMSGRLNSDGFVFASLLDRPLVLPLLGVLWMAGIVPGPIALVAGLQDLATCVWTFWVWRKEFRPAADS